MTNTHVFIVDKETFPVHLKYMFIGTGSSDKEVDFNNKDNSQLHSSSEIILCSMMADMSRVRIGDYVIFYLLQNIKNKIKDGKFYGVFKIQNNPSVCNGEYLKDYLKKKLIFRIKIEPHEVYSKGVTEWEALDSIKGLTSPNQMLWSLIYRKLKAMRGNTMITLYEKDRLIQMIRTKNSRKELHSSSGYGFDITSQLIIQSNNQQYNNQSSKNINLLPRLIVRYNEKKQFESHLQQYICQNIDTNNELMNLILNYQNMSWLGNEVSCGVGMQRIDILVRIKQNDHKTIIPIELKSREADEDHLRQLQRYIDWLEQYYVPNDICDIQPVLITKKGKQNISDSLSQAMRSFNSQNSDHLQLKHIEFEIIKNRICFKQL